VPAELLNVPFSLDLLVNSGAHRVVAAQSYLTFDPGMLRVVDPTTRSCTEASLVAPDTTIFDRVLQNEVCNGPAPCTFRGNLVPPGSIAFASAAFLNPPMSGAFHVARIAFCANGPGTVTLHWQFSPPAPPDRDSAILDLVESLAHNRALYTDFVLDLGGSGTPVPTGTPGAGPSATPTARRTPSPVPTHTATAAPVHFADVQPTDYFYVPVQYLASRGVISGYADGTFRPYNNTTRGQLAKIVVLAEGWALDTTGGPHFRDVPPGSAFYSVVETAYNRGIISGYGCGTGCREFRPGANVTRAQLCKILVGAEGWAVATQGGPYFRDVPETDPFYAYIETAYSHNLISGYGCGVGCAEFRPGKNATRGQISKIVYGAVTQP
jgi:hypothetical protein